MLAPGRCRVSPAALDLLRMEDEPEFYLGEGVAICYRANLTPELSSVDIRRTQQGKRERFQGLTGVVTT